MITQNWTKYRKGIIEIIQEELSNLYPKWEFEYVEDWHFGNTIKIVRVLKDFGAIEIRKWDKTESFEIFRKLGTFNLDIPPKVNRKTFITTIAQKQKIEELFKKVQNLNKFKDSYLQLSDPVLGEPKFWELDIPINKGEKKRTFYWETTDYTHSQYELIKDNLDNLVAFVNMIIED